VVEVLEGERRGVGKERETEERMKKERGKEEGWERRGTRWRVGVGVGGEAVIIPRAFRCCLNGGGLTGVNHQIRVQYYLIVIVN
jgi:hypothetical protein